MGLFDSLKGMFGKKAEPTQNEMPAQPVAPVQGEVGQPNNVVPGNQDVTPNLGVPPSAPAADDKQDENVGTPPTSFPQ